MKRVYVLFLAILLTLTGCTSKVKGKDVSVKDVCCPYKIDHSAGGIELSFRDAEKIGLNWHVNAIPEDTCEVTQADNKKEYACQYRIDGREEGLAQLTFTATQEDETVVFELVLLVNVNAKGKAIVTSYQHRERVGASVEEDGLKYSWNVDIDGTLHFSFVNMQDHWRVYGDGENICTLSNQMATPAGCKFSAQPIAAGKTTVELIGEETQRKISVVIKVDKNMDLAVVSVQER